MVKSVRRIDDVCQLVEFVTCVCIQGVTGGMCETSGECSLC